MADGYTLVPEPAPLAAYLRLRVDAGMTPRTEAQARLALAGTWYGCHVVHDETGEVAAMGRVVGDGGWYFLIADMATLPHHQRRGLGSVVMSALLSRIEEQTPERAFVSLLADPPGRALYAKHGFVPSADAYDSVGMCRWLE
jgi:GNAT superfamily N-acetyltransferase